MLRLSNQIRSRITGLGAPIGDDDHLARSRNRIDRHSPIDQSLRQSHKQIPWPNDHVDCGNLRNAVCQTRNPLRSPNGIHLLDSKLMASRQDFRIVSSKRGRGGHDRYLPNTCDQRRNGRHEDRRWIGSSPARHADPNTCQGCVTLLEQRTVPIRDLDVLVQDRSLETFDVSSDLPHRSKKLLRDRSVRCGHPIARNPQAFGDNVRIVQHPGILENRLGFAFLYVLANPLDYLLGTERLTKQRHRQLCRSLRDDRPVWTELLAQLFEPLLKIRSRRIESR